MKSLDYIGSISSANTIAARTLELTHAYPQFLADKHYQDNDFFKRPIMTRENYQYAYPYAALCPNNNCQIANIIRTLYPGGKTFYWPECLPDRAQVNKLTHFIANIVDCENKKTLAIVNFPLVNWAGGELATQIIKNISCHEQDKVLMFSPSHGIPDIVEIISSHKNLVERILIVCRPSQIPELILSADTQSITLPFDKIRYLVAGEVFPEQLRQNIETLSNLPRMFEHIMSSLYVLPETGLLGFESIAGAAMRQLLSHNSALREKLHIQSNNIPTFHHLIDDSILVESHHDKMLLTKWQGIPLVRYATDANIKLFSWKMLQDKFISLREFDQRDQALYDLIAKAPNDLPDIIAVFGRQDQAVSLAGVPISHDEIHRCLHADELISLLTGRYHVEIEYTETGKERIALVLEARPELTLDQLDINYIYHSIISSLCMQNSRFSIDYNQQYQYFDKQPGNRIIHLSFIQKQKFSGLDRGYLENYKLLQSHHS